MTDDRESPESVLERANNDVDRVAPVTYLDALRAAIRQRDEARTELKRLGDDFQSVWDSRDEVIQERERARLACNTYWHDLSRIARLCGMTDDEYPLKAVERVVKERDALLIEIARLRATKE